jgi:peptidylprolyl isomerase
MAEPENTLIIETTKGPVTVELRPDLAPNHVARIKELARQGFYDGVVFHRVIDGFMAQTGDPTGTGRDSQFFICFDDATFLDRQYTVWGRVIDGMDNVDKLTRGEPPSRPDKMLSVRVVADAA